MGDWPTESGSRIVDIASNTGTSSGTVVTSSATANTKGTWTQLIASTAFTSSALIVLLNGPGVPVLLDVGVGASGSEVAIVSNIHASAPAGTGGNLPISVLFPIAIPAGSRVSARLAASTGSSGASMNAWVIGGGFGQDPPMSLVTTYGAVTGTSRGTSVDPGATANTKGVWVQMVASTTSSIDRLVIGAGNRGNASAAQTGWLADVGVGASGSEAVLIPNYRIVASTNNTLAPTYSHVMPVSIPAGSRLAVRSQCGITASPGRLIDFLLYAIS